MKSTLVKFIVIISLLSSLHANALVGLASNDQGMVIAGAALIDISSITVLDRSVHYRPGRRAVIYTYRTFVYMPLALFGVFMLDNNGNPDFQKIDSKMADAIGINEDELIAYNRDLEQINAVKDMISEDVAHISNQDDKMNAIGQAWNYSAEVLSTNALSAVMKISNTLQTK